MGRKLKNIILILCTIWWPIIRRMIYRVQIGLVVFFKFLFVNGGRNIVNETHICYVFVFDEMYCLINLFIIDYFVYIVNSHNQ
jgi:hypothetical protein